MKWPILARIFGPPSGGAHCRFLTLGKPRWGSTYGKYACAPRGLPSVFDVTIPRRPDLDQSCGQYGPFCSVDAPYPVVAAVLYRFKVFLLPPYFENFGKRVTKSPKLYFYEPGFAAYLLGIESPEQLERDPARGGLFENLVVAECKKTRYNMGLDDNLYFFRDHRGEEVDLVYARGRDLVAVEIKSAATFDPSFFRGLVRFSDLVGRRARNPTVVYAGSAMPTAKGIQTMNFCDAATLVCQ